MIFSRIFNSQKKRRKSETTFEHEISALRVSSDSDLFLNLPSEIHIYITRFLAWPTITNLRLTCSQLATTLTKESLSSIHQRCSARLLTIERETAAATRKAMRSDWDEIQLPCYRCHRWMNSGGDLSKSAFSRGKGTSSFGPGGIKAAERICIQCGIRSEFYPPGTKINLKGICYVCKKYGPTRKPPGPVTRSPLGRFQISAKAVERGWILDSWSYYFRCSGYCEDCLENDEIFHTAQKLAHERLWSKYEKGMKSGKGYRESKGKRIREERGIAEPDTSTQHELGHFCPVMKERRYCSCWKDIKHTIQ